MAPLSTLVTELSQVLVNSRRSLAFRIARLTNQIDPAYAFESRGAPRRGIFRVEHAELLQIKHRMRFVNAAASLARGLLLVRDKGSDRSGAGKSSFLDIFSARPRGKLRPR